MRPVSVSKACATILWLAITGATAAEPGANRMENGGFEADETRAPGWRVSGDRAHMVLDGEIKHSGRRSLRVTGPGGMVSTPASYPGGRVKASAWIKTKNVVRGPSRNWHQAAFQIISHDRDGTARGHADIILLDGTNNWQRYEKTILLSREVKSVSVKCHLWGGDTTGTTWFDDVSLEFPDEGNPAFARRPLDLRQAAVTVDCDRDLGEFRHLWIGSDAGHMDRVISATQVNAMRHAHSFGFRYLRMHNCVHNPRIYSENEKGDPVFSWETFDQRIGTVVENGFRPVIVLEGMPPEIAGKDDGKNWQNPFPPADEAGYHKWQRICHELVKHCREKWGDGIHEWFFEVWNEPDAKGYFQGSLDEYLAIYDHAVAGAVAADPDIQIGGPAGAGTDWLRPMLEHCATGKNTATGGTGTRLDFLSWHIYTVGVGIPTFDKIDLSLATARMALDEFPRYRDLPTIITEWGCASSPSATHDRPYDAAFRLMAVGKLMDGGVTLALPFALGAGPPNCHEGFQRGLAMITKTTIPKPSFRTFELLSRMTGRRIACESSNDPIGGLACLSEDGQRAWMALYNLVEDPNRESYETAVTVHLKSLPEGTWLCRSTAIVPGQCDPFLAWKEMGRPEALSPDQRNVLLEASKLPPPADVPIRDGSLQVKMPASSVLLLELAR